MTGLTRRAAVAVLALGLTLPGGLAGCSGPGDDRPLIVVSTNILGDVVEEVAGGQAEVVTLMPPNADPHSFEISARDAARMRSADLIVSNGLGLEEGVQQHLDGAAAEGVATFVAGDAVEVLAYARGDAAGNPDAHFWTDPNQMVAVVDALGEELSGIDGIDADEVEEQTTVYADELRAVDEQMAEAFAAIPDERRALVTNHHVFGYLAERYDFRIIGAVIPGGTTLASPSASDLAELVDAIETTGVPTVFAETSSPDRLVQALADEAEVDVEVVALYSESLTAPGDGADSYLAMLRANTDRISRGLS